MVSIKTKIVSTVKAAKRRAIALPRKTVCIVKKMLVRVDLTRPAPVASTEQAASTAHAPVATVVTSATQSEDETARLVQLTAELATLTTENTAKAKANAETYNKYEDLSRAFDLNRYTLKKARQNEEHALFLVLEPLSELEAQITADAKTHDELFGEWQSVHDQLTANDRQLKAKQRQVDARAMKHHRAVLEFAKSTFSPAVATV